MTANNTLEVVERMREKGIPQVLKTNQGRVERLRREGGKVEEGGWRG